MVVGVFLLTPLLIRSRAALRHEVLDVTSSFAQGVDDEATEIETRMARPLLGHRRWLPHRS